ncbi:ABC transporter permease [Paenibacillus oenotherae]|uniref:ABC transporter permease n=1 Tax=Paenibacillus oenotherae TaxID=1435645 RepID=A0ABS7D3Q1_9BACL|nr:ABC transporter permease [Paenibacillus oenotherae]MBW7474489.1 ABC transporter permease [Paenibacillus oenotherae]
MNRSVDAIWRQRAGRFWQESMPYIRYMVQSGVPLVASMLLFTGIASYVGLLRAVPAAFPFTWVGVIVLTPFSCWSPLRTWLREADTVFLMPREAEMKLYLGQSFRYNGIAGTAALLLLCLIYCPLYVQGPGQLDWPLLLLAAVLVKLLNTAGAWQERRMPWQGARFSIRMLRWIVTAAGLALLLQASPWLAVAYVIAAALLMALLYRSQRKYRLPWLLLIAEETRTRRRYNVFFSAFTDVPSERAQVAKRNYLAWLAARSRYSKGNAFVYLYGHTLIRTELGGIIMRLTALGTVVGTLTAHSGLGLGWGSAGVNLLFVWLTGVQLGSLVQSHRHSVWRHVYPLPDKARLSALLRIDRIASLICISVLWLPQIILLPGQGLLAPAVTAALLGLGYIFVIRPVGLKRNFARTDDD